MTPHTHTTYVPGCYRCELSRDEVNDNTGDKMSPMSNREQTLRFWDKDWGDPEEYLEDFDDGIKGLAGFHIGDNVVVTVEVAEDPRSPGSVNGYEDDEGIVVGFAKPSQGGGPFNLPVTGHNLWVMFDDRDDPVVIDPADVEQFAV